MGLRRSPPLVMSGGKSGGGVGTDRCGSPRRMMPAFTRMVRYEGYRTDQ
jgi:hypothetical protein